MKHNNVIRIGVIGLGVMGMRHAQVCHEMRGVELVGVADIKPDVVARASEQFGVPGFADYKEMLEKIALDAVVVATSDQFHRAPCELAAARGIYIFLEKPIAMNLADGQAIIDAARQHNVKLMVGHTLRYDPRYIAVQQAAADGKFGDIIHLYARRNATVRSSRRLEGRADAVMFQGVHDIDAFHWITGAKVTRVSAESVSKVLADLKIPDATIATLRFSNGAIALMEQSWALPIGVPALLDAQLEVVGSKGAAYIDFHQPSLALFTDGVWSQPDVILALPGAHYLKDEYEQFLAFVAGEAEPKVSGEDALEALRVALAIVESAKSGKPVDL
ncbi:MAG: Gfo/Idh/MocA family oxidoreductase [Chloroflexota bacterium]